ncbi:uncharacterized protein BJX67DRAFT_345871 [Aspergillus lucknowensis]|uniref:Suppressor of anucleate metulae protein B n=1 Tax=Aspergillus lucknowensis TaxID=176173 RepID=A0ABR4M125_9EURO
MPATQKSYSHNPTHLIRVPPGPSPSDGQGGLMRMAAHTGICDVCEGRNRGNMRRCSRCTWQTCHGECESNPRCSYQYNRRRCIHYCDPKHRVHQFQPASGDVCALQRNRPNRPRKRPSKSKRSGSQKGSSIESLSQHYVPGPSTGPTYADDNTSIHGGSHESSYDSNVLDGASRLYAISWEAWIDECSELYGDGPGNSHGCAMEKAKQALKDFNMRYLSIEDRVRDRELIETDYEADYDDDEEEDDIAVEPTFESSGEAAVWVSKGKILDIKYHGK